MNSCLEYCGIHLDDTITKIFQRTSGEIDDSSKTLKNFLDYVDDHPPVDDLMREIANEVITAKSYDEWMREYMTLALSVPVVPIVPVFL